MYLVCTAGTQVHAWLGTSD